VRHNWQPASQAEAPSDAIEELNSSLSGAQMEWIPVSCPSVRTICEKSRKCFALDLVRQLHSAKAAEDTHHHSNVFISADNIRLGEEVDNFEKTRELLRSKHLRIRSVLAWRDNAGFYSYPLYVINQLRFAKMLGLIGEKQPFVYMPESHHYFDACDDERRSNETIFNFWDRWFEPISNVTVKMMEDFAEEDVWEFDQATIQNIHHDGKAVHAYPYSTTGLEIRGDVGTQDWINCMRSRAMTVVEEHIAVKPALVKEALELHTSLFSGSKKVLGVHLRGTDKWITEIVNVDKYLNTLEDYNKKNPDGKFFVATDDPRFLRKMQQKYGSLVRALPVQRELTNVFYDDSVDKDHKCHDVLLDTLVLSMLSFVVKPWSAVSEFAVYFHHRYFPDIPLVVKDMQLNERDLDDKSSNCKA